MKLIIAGTRTINMDIGTIQNMIDYLIPMDIEITEVISGEARGMDVSGRNWAEFQKIPVKKFPADWNTHGKAAGHIRNAEMAKYGDALLLVWDGQSKGSANMKANMKKLNKPIYEVTLTGSI